MEFVFLFLSFCGLVTLSIVSYIIHAYLMCNVIKDIAYGPFTWGHVCNYKKSYTFTLLFLDVLE